MNHAGLLFMHIYCTIKIEFQLKSEAIHVIGIVHSAFRNYRDLL